MNKLFRLVLSLTTLLSLNAFATSAVHIECAGTDITVTGSLLKTRTGFEGQLMAAGPRVPQSLSGSRSYQGTYDFKPAGQFYRYHDLEVVTFLTKSDTDNIYGKSYVAIDGSVIQVIYVNGVVIPVTCHFSVN